MNEFLEFERSAEVGEGFNKSEERAAKRKARNARARANRKAREGIMKSMGLVKVRGAVSGKIYWE